MEQNDIKKISEEMEEILGSCGGRQAKVPSEAGGSRRGLLAG